MRHNLSYIQFYPTLRCNYACDFCFNRHLLPLPDVRPEAFAEMASILKSAGIGHIDILGGEPTLHRDIGTLVDTIFANGMRTTMSSNGSRVDRLAALSKTYPASSVRIGISLNGRTISTKLHGYILNCRPILKSIFSETSPIPREYDPYIGMDGSTWYAIYPDLADESDLAGRVPFPVFYRHLRQMKQARKGIDGVFCSGFLPDTDHHPQLAGVRCPAGTTKLSVLPGGDVYPCYLFFRHPEFRLGNLLSDDLDHITGHPVLDFFRSFGGNRCPDTACGLHGRCHGGCPAMSYTIYGDLDAPEPRCVAPSAWTALQKFPAPRRTRIKISIPIEPQQESPT